MNLPTREQMKRTLLSIFIILCAAQGAFAAFEDMQPGTEAKSIGCAVVAKQKKAYSIFYNPAGLGGMNYFEISSGYGRALMGLSDSSSIGDAYMFFAFPVKGTGTLGIGWTNTTLASAYQEHEIIASFGKDINEWLCAGVNIKALYKGFSPDAYTVIDPLFTNNGYNKLNLSVDFGLQLRLPSDPFTFGLVFQNVNSPDMALTNGDPVPLSIRAGVGYVSNIWEAELDWQMRGKENVFMFGGKADILKKNLVFDGGFIIGTQGLKEVDAGFQIGTSSLDFCYTFRLPMGGINGTSGSHDIGLSFRFGSEMPVFEDEKSIEILEKNAEKLEADLAFTKQDAEKAKVAAEEEAKNLKEQVAAREAEIKKFQDQAENVSKLLELANRKIYEDAAAKARRPAAEGKKDTQFHTVVKGDRLQDLSQKYYGNESRWTTIYEANKDKISGGVLVPGTVLVIPR